MDHALDHQLHNEMGRDRKLYVLVRSDLTHGQQLAQLGHACAYYGQRYPKATLAHPTICVLAVADEAELVRYYHRAIDPGTDPVFIFLEPDMGTLGEYTALATTSDGAIFRDLHLAGGPHKLPFYRRLYRSLNERFTR